MERELKVQIEGMSCDHCKRTLEEGIGKIPGVKSVAVDVKAKTATVKVLDSASVQTKLFEVIEDLGYELQKGGT